MFTDGLIIVAAGLLAYAALHDIAARTVPNWLCLGLALVGLGLRLADHSLRAGLFVALLTFIVLFAIWAGGFMGGGDVKLWAATVLLIPPHWQIELTFFARVMVMGGVLALLYLGLWLTATRLNIQPVAFSRRSSRFLSRLLRAEIWRITRRGPLPYAVAISGSALFTLLPFSLQR